MIRGSSGAQLLSSFRFTAFPASFFLQTRTYKKKWHGDEIQLFASQYQHNSAKEHEEYQLRRYKYAKKGLVAPRANDYDTPEEDITEAMDDMMPETWDPKEFKKEFEEDTLEAYRDFRREQKVAQDDPKNPYYFSDEEEAKNKAMEEAVTAGMAKQERRLLDNAGGLPSGKGKHSVVTDPTPARHAPSGSFLTNYIPDPEPVTYPEWQPYIPEMPFKPTPTGTKAKKGFPFKLPEIREMKRLPNGSAMASGSRKNASATATIIRGEGKIIVNGKELVDYFKTQDCREAVLAPLLVTECLLSFDIKAHVRGGGVKGQAGAIRHAISRALQNYDPSFRPVLKQTGLLTRDARMVERKKPGKPGARKSFQWVKR